MAPVAGRRGGGRLKALVAGWFSFSEGHATAGDVLAGDVVAQWLADARIPCDVAIVPPMGQGIDWRTADPQAYTHVVFVCGPFQRGELECSFFTRFAGCRLVGVDLTMLEPLAAWNPFDHLIERDSDRRVHPDIAMASRDGRVPLVGVCRVEEYGGAQVAEANAAIDGLIARSRVAIVEVDTRLDNNATGLRSAGEVESVLARMDAVVTTRLHGLVLSLKHGVPVLAIDPEPGGAKLRRQAERLGWVPVFDVDALDERALSDALAYCLSGDAKQRALEARARALTGIDEMRSEFLAVLGKRPVLDAPQAARAARLVSVVIPCYNHAHYLGHAIESVLAQTHRHFEIVVVDDGSTDGTAEVAARYAEVRVVRQCNAGLSTARNAGLAASRGEYVVFLDADDRLLPDALQAGLNSLFLHPEAAFVSGHFRYINADGSLRKQQPQLPLESPPYEGMLRGNYITMHATVMYRRAIFDEVGGFDPALRSCEDYDLYLRITRGHPVARHDEVVAEYRRHNDSMSIRAGRMLDTALTVLGSQWEHVQAEPQLARACQQGVRSMRRYLIRPLGAAIVEAVRTRQWPRVAGLLAEIPAYAPPAARAAWLDLRLGLRRRRREGPPTQR